MDCTDKYFSLEESWKITYFLFAAGIERAVLTRGPAMRAALPKPHGHQQVMSHQCTTTTQASYLRCWSFSQAARLTLAVFQSNYVECRCSAADFLPHPAPHLQALQGPNYLRHSEGDPTSGHPALGDYFSPNAL